MLKRLNSIPLNGRQATTVVDEPSNEVDAKLDRVNELWNRVERKLLRRQPPRTITVEVHHRHTGEEGEMLVRSFLGVQRQHGKWRLCFAEDYTTHYEDDPYPDLPANLGWKPITECDLETRIFAASFVDKLQFEVDNTRTFFIPQLDQTISRLEEVLDNE